MGKEIKRSIIMETVSGRSTNNITHAVLLFSLLTPIPRTITIRYYYALILYFPRT